MLLYVESKDEFTQKLSQKGKVILIDFFNGNYTTLFYNREIKSQEPLYNVIDTFLQYTVKANCSGLSCRRLQHCITAEAFPLAIPHPGQGGRGKLLFCGMNIYITK